MADVFSHPEPPQPPPSPSKRRVADATENPTDTTLVLSTLAEFLTKLEATKTKTAKKYQIPIDDWQLITAYVTQLQKNHHRATDLTDNVTALGLAISQLSSTVSKRLDSIEDRLESEPPLEPINYAAAAMQEPAPRLAAPPAPSGRNTELDMTLVQSDPSKPVYAQIGFPDLKKRIDTAISEAGVTRPNGTVVSIRAVSRHASKDLIITANSRIDMDLLRNTPSWLTAFSDRLSIRKAIYPVIVHCISTTLGLSTPEAIAELKADNPDALTSLTRVMWANPKKALNTGSEKKNHSSVIMHLTNPIEANNLIRHFCVLRGETHPAEKSRRSLISCHRCTNWGHTAARCSAPITCARCAGKHLTVNCNCTESAATKCIDHYSCSHIVTCRSQCKGDHRASSRECLARIKAQAKLDEINLRDGPLFFINV
jgi:hypothetical protein